jgi:cell division protein FtsB
MIVTKTIQPTELSGSMVANAICELNGCFGHINRYGLMDYVFLKGFTEALYPSDNLYPAEDLFPKGDNFHKYYSTDYPSGGCDYQDYVVRKITGLEIRQSEDSVGAFVGERENPYVVSDNFLTYGKSTEEMTTIAENMFSVIKDIEYRPFTLNTFRGNPCVEVGDGIKIYTDNQIIQSYVLNRTLTGIQALSDSFETNGKEYRTTQVNSVQSQITQLKGKANRIERTVEETRSEIEDMEQGLSSQITQTSNAIASEVSRATGAENELSSRITQTANSISSKVSKGEVISEINQTAEQVKIQANKIALEGTVTANGNVTIGTDGKLTAKNGSFEGIVDATSIQIKDKISMYSAGITIPKILRDIISYDEKYNDDYKPIVIGDGKSVVNIKNLSADLQGKVECTDSTNRIPIGTSNSGNYDVAYINSKAQNASGAYLITVNGLWETDEFASHNIVSASSDIRLKDNIKPTKVENALDVINKFELYEFDWKESGAHQDIGFIADYLQEVDERLAVGGGYEEDGTPNYKTVDNFYMQGYIVKAMQELSQENKELKSEIDELKKSVSFLIEKLGGMKNE